MKIALFVVGKTNQDFLAEELQNIMNDYSIILNLKYLKFQTLKKSRSYQILNLKKEGELILKQIRPADYLVLLDEKGKDLTSVKFAKLQFWMLTGRKRIVFVCGGAYGFSDELYHRKNETLSLSKMTFSHQMVRLFL